MFTRHYNKLEFDFAGMLAVYFGVDDLSRLHTLLSTNEIMPPGKDSQTPIHKEFYKITKPFYSLYHRFLFDEVVPNLRSYGFLQEREYLYQRIPSFRLHAPKNKAVGAFHKDGDYNHPDGEINIWLPLTYAFESNTMHVEFTPGSNEFVPVELNVGEYLVFDGRNLRHGNYVNETGFSRVSLDFRLLPKSKYDEYIKSNAPLSSVQANVPFTVGGYYGIGR